MDIIDNHINYVEFKAKNLDLIKNKINESGGKISKDIFSFPGGRRFHFIDPAGNELAVWSDN